MSISLRDLNGHNKRLQERVEIYVSRHLKLVGTLTRLLHERKTLVSFNPNFKKNMSILNRVPVFCWDMSLVYFEKAI